MKVSRPKLGVNIDHVATLRQARRELAPDPICAAKVCEEAGADSIVAHLREDRRHIQDSDIVALRRTVRTRFNLEMSMAPDILAVALKVKPDYATLVPERRQEITTEGGLDIFKNFFRLQRAVGKLQAGGIPVSLFIAPDKHHIKKCKETGSKIIELHTGPYALARTKSAVQRELRRLQESSDYARSLGLVVNAGHGLNYQNARAVAQIEGIHELNIGHSIVSRAVFVGLKTAVREMLRIIREG